MRLDTHIQCIVVFPQQQWLAEPSTMLRYVYIAEPVTFFRTSWRAPGSTGLLREGYHGSSPNIKAAGGWT